MLRGHRRVLGVCRPRRPRPGRGQGRHARPHRGCPGGGLLEAGLARPRVAHAHRAYFPEGHTRRDRPWFIDDPTSAHALFAALARPVETHYYVFLGQRGQTIPVGILSPQLDGHADFAPSREMVGPDGLGSYVTPLSSGAPQPFYEPHHQAHYWWRQRDRIGLPTDGLHLLRGSHPLGRSGRCCLVVGNREGGEGDPDTLAKRARFWTPLL